MPVFVFFGSGETVVDVVASDTLTLEDAIDAAIEIQEQFDVSDTETLEDAIEASSLDTSGPIDVPVSDTLITEDEIDAEVLEVVFLVIDTTDTFTLENAIDEIQNVALLVDVSDNLSLEDSVDGLPVVSAELNPSDMFLLDDEIDDAEIFAELAASDTETLEDDIDTSPASVRGSRGILFHLYIDWLADGNYQDYADCVLFPISYSRGTNQINDKIAVGEASFTLKNDTGSFSPLNENGPYWPYIVGSVPFYFSVEVFGQEYRLFTGSIFDITHDPDNDEPVVELKCVDVVYNLSGPEIRDELYEDEYTGNIFASILENSYPHDVYENLVVGLGPLAYWPIARQRPQLLYDSFQESVAVSFSKTNCENRILPSETGQPWVMYCGSGNFISQVFLSKYYWHYSNAAIDINKVRPGVEIIWRDSLSPYHIALIAETEEQNVIHKVTLDQTIAVNPPMPGGDDASLRTTAYGATCIIRFTDIDNFIFMKQTFSGYELLKVELGVETVLDSVVQVPGVQDVMRLDAFDDDIVGYVNDVAVLSATTSFNQTATKHGFGRYIDGSATHYLRIGIVETLSRTVQDISGNAHDGVYYGDPGPIFEDGKYADLQDPAVFDITTSLSLGFWYKKHQSGAIPLVVKEDAYGVRQDASDKPYGFVVISGTEYATPVAALDALGTVSYFLEMRRSGTSLELYIDGALAESVAIPGGSIDTNANPLLVAKEGASVADAEIWDVSLHSPALTADDIASQYASKTQLGLTRDISRGRQQLQLFAPSGTKLWDTGQVLAFEELGGHTYVTGDGVVRFKDRWDWSREPIYARFENCGLIAAPIEVLHDDLYDAYQARWKEFNTFDEDNQWIIWQSIVADGENHARMNKLIKPGVDAPENTFVGSWEKSGIQVRPGSIDPDTHIAFVVTSQPSTGLDPYDQVFDVEIAEFVYDDQEFSITFRNNSAEDRYIFNLEIKISEGAIIQKLPIDFVKERSSGFIRKTGNVRKDEFEWNSDGEILNQVVNVRSKIGKNIHPRPSVSISDISESMLLTLLLADIGKRIYVKDDTHPYSTKMDGEYMIVGISVDISDTQVNVTWRLFDDVLAEAHYFIIGQSAIDSERVITF